MSKKRNNNDKSSTNKNSRTNKTYNNGKSYYSNKKKYSNKDDESVSKQTVGRDNPDAYKSNDISWYNRNPIMFADATRVPFNKISGVPYPRTISFMDSSIDHRKISGNVAPAGVMRVTYMPGIGISDNYASAPNRAFQAMWSAIYSKTTGAMQFPQYTLGLIVTTVMSIAQNLAAAKRIVETSQLYSGKNRNYPMALLEAQGVDPGSIIGWQDEYRVKLNNLIKDFNSLSLPAYLDVFKRHYALARNVFADQNSLTAQLYVFVPSCYYVYSDLGYYNGSEFDGKATSLAVVNPFAVDKKQDAFKLLTIIATQLESIRSSTDYYNVAGAIIRAFPDNALMVIDEVAVDSVLQPVLDDVIPYQIHNCNVVGYPEQLRYSYKIPGDSDTQTLQIWDRHRIGSDPVSNVILYHPVVPAADATTHFTGNQVNDGLILNTFKESITSEDVMEFTRLMSSWDYDDDVGDDYVIAKALGTEYINALEVWVPGTTAAFENITESKDLEMYHVKIPGVIVPYGTAADQNLVDYDVVVELLAMTDAITKFHRAPRVMLAAARDSADHQYMGYIGDINLWTIVEMSMLQGLHETALLSIFSTTVPIRL